jgi:hypothetical protein
VVLLEEVAAGVVYQEQTVDYRVVEELVVMRGQEVQVGTIRVFLALAREVAVLAG